MSDLEGKIARYLQECRELAGLAEGGGCWQADSIEFELLEIKGRRVIIAVRFIEIMREAPCSGIEQVDRHGCLRLELDEFGDISSTHVC